MFKVMYILPIAMRERRAHVKQVSVLLERNGTHLISLDGTGEEFAELNGLILSGKPFQVGSILYLPVDVDRTDFSAFYSWREVAPGTVPSKEVWRQFVWVSDSLDVNTMLNEISIGDSGMTVYSVLAAYLKGNH